MQIKHGITPANAQSMPEEAPTIRKDHFHLSNSRLWHFPLKWLLVGWGSGRWRICCDILGEPSFRKLQLKESQQTALQLGLQHD